MTYHSQNLNKDGCVGCRYDLLPGETMLACLRRMESERKFDR